MDTTDEQTLASVPFEAIGQAIRRARLRRPVITQGELAEAIGTTRTYVNAIERGRTPLTLSKLYEIAAVLDVAPAFLLSGGPARETRPEDV